MEPTANSVPPSRVQHQTFHVPLSAIPANVLSQLQEVPSSGSPGRVYRLPPGVVLLKPTVGQVVPAPSGSGSGSMVMQLQAASAAKGASTSEILNAAKQGVPVRLNDKPNQRIVVVKSPAGTILSRTNAVVPVSAQSVQNQQPVPSTSTAPLLRIKPGAPLVLEKSGNGAIVVKPTTGNTVSTSNPVAPIRSPPPLVARATAVKAPLQLKSSPEKPAGKDSPKSSSGTETKPKPWSREPRPLWKSKEPIVLYSGCKPENLLPKKKKEEPPKSLPCPQKLDDVLPKTVEYHISSYEEMQNPDHFKAEVRTTFTTKEEALQWIQDFEAISGTNFRVTKTFKENSFRLIFKKCFKCHKNSCKKDTVMKRESGRNLGCEARLSVTIKRSDMKSSTDLLLSKFPCVIGIHHNHCHALTADALRHRRPLPELKVKFSNMFKARITPSAARRLHLQDLQREYGDKYAEVIQDGARCPPLPWFYRLYYETVGSRVKEGRKKSNRRSYYKKKTSTVTRNPGQALVDFNTGVETNSENVINTSFPASGLSDKQEEIQTSINSLYEYDFMSKTGEGRDDEMINGVQIGDGTENHAVLSDNSQDNHVIDNSELLTSHDEPSNDDYMDSTDMLDGTECVGEFVTSGEILNDHATTSNEEVETADQGLNDLTSSDGHQNEEQEMALQNLTNVFNDLSARLQNDPQKYLLAVNKFISQYDECQTSSESDLLSALNEFGTQKSTSPNNVPSSLENSVSDIVEKYLVKKKNQASSRESENLVSPKRKVLVLRMNPNKFNQIMGKVGKHGNKNVINI